MKYFTTVLLLCVSVFSFAGSYSKQDQIGLVKFNANANLIYVYPKTGLWSNGACPSVYMASNMPGYDGFVSMVLAAKLAGKEVKFLVIAIQ